LVAEQDEDKGTRRVVSAEFRRAVPTTPDTLGKKKSSRIMVVNVAEKPKQDSGRHDWERRI
jgi:hypothetical protein